MSSNRGLEQIRKDNTTRLHRARVWEKVVKNNEALQSDQPTHFIFWWIAFESLFACGDENQKEFIKRNNFIERIIGLDKEKRIEKALKQESETMLALVKLRATHSGLWSNPISNRGDKRQYENHNKWEEMFNKDVIVIEELKNILKVMNVLFDRLSTVRHQIFHGASSREGSHGYSQVFLGANLLAVFVPIFIDIVEKNAGTKSWGEVSFPPLSKPDDKTLMPIWPDKFSPSRKKNQHSRHRSKKN